MTKISTFFIMKNIEKENSLIDYKFHLTKKIIDFQEYSFLKEKFLLKDRIYEGREDNEVATIIYNCIDLNDDGQILINPEKKLTSLEVSINLFYRDKQEVYLINFNDYKNKESFWVKKSNLQSFINKFKKKYFEYDNNNPKSFQAKLNDNLKDF